MTNCLRIKNYKIQINNLNGKIKFYIMEMKHNVEVFILQEKSEQEKHN